jgi:hypothetical protein
MLAERWFEDDTQAGDEALCRDGTGTLVALFFSEQLDDIARAKAICAECPVRQRCFEGALARREPYGVWGGLTEDDREAIYATERRRPMPVAV